MNDARYESSLEYLSGLERFGSVFGLENISRLLGAIGDPHRSLRTVHVAGTNGKGSVATMISCILKAAGYRVGKYTSPHLVSFTERITVNEEEIGEDEVASLTEHIRERAHGTGPDPFYTYFDFTTALAFEHFRREKIDIAVVETGLGGRLDSTNVIEPLTTVVTNVAFDHMKELGGTIGKIAGEKAGIIKKGVPLITGARGRALEVLEARARELASPIHVLGRDFLGRKKGERRFSYRGIGWDCDNIALNLEGDHQLFNAALALCAVESLSRGGFRVGEDHVRDALASVRWQGRLETVRERPLVILDGAHNLSGVRALTRFLRSRYRDRRKVLVFGVMRDKQYGRMLEVMNGCVDLAILTQPNTERALEAESMRGLARNPIVTKDTKSALRKARQLAGDRDLILVTGSLYTIGEAKRVVNEIF
ncbi:MAG TPA: folylpolyglutamate synthase/dihydrofolate synthase family protein [Syntrophorhabdaceae bacterium]|nr:folylpolyglutamate synthase/dihydrofolate synthase family protein [Syntrophorhabdaceae bacterium]